MMRPLYQPDNYLFEASQPAQTPQRRVAEMPAGSARLEEGAQGERRGQPVRLRLQAAALRDADDVAPQPVRSQADLWTRWSGIVVHGQAALNMRTRMLCLRMMPHPRLSVVTVVWQASDRGKALPHTNLLDNSLPGQ